MKNKIALGAAQFGLTYGIANAVGQVSFEEVARIILRARTEGVDTIDTAIAYGSSEVSLGFAGVDGFRVISKLPPLPPNTKNVVKWIVNQVEKSLERLKISRLEAVLLHNSEDITGAYASEYCEAFNLLKSSNLSLATGVSIYDPKELDLIWRQQKLWLPDIIQSPLNIFDQRLVESGWLTKLAGQGIRVHVRSIFLQGLLLMPAVKRPSYFKPWESNLNNWLNWCESEDIGCLPAALRFVMMQPEIERVVLGVDSLNQFEEILVDSDSDIRSEMELFRTDDLGLIDPRQWKLS